MKILRIVLATLVGLGLVFGIALAVTGPEPLPDGTESALRLRPGPHPVDLSEQVWTDPSRPTSANGDYPGSPEREMSVALWSPAGAPGPHPLVVYSHGFMSDRHGGAHLAEHLASHGYVVVSASHPLTHYSAPGGPNADDVVHQPADVSFMIDQVLGLAPGERPFLGEIDPERIGVFGVSLGGLTTTLVAYHPRLRDPRIRAAVSIAGPGVFFGPRYFDQADVPFLMIAATHDAMIDYETNARPIPDRIREGGLLTIEGASHAGFSHLTSGPIRLLGNPDELGCGSLMQNLEVDSGENPFEDLGGPEDGFLDPGDSPMPCEVRFEEAMHPGRQQMLATLAVHAFFESHFARASNEREGHGRFLATTFSEEIAEVSFRPARR